MGVTLKFDCIPNSCICDDYRKSNANDIVKVLTSDLWGRSKEHQHIFDNWIVLGVDTKNEFIART